MNSKLKKYLQKHLRDSDKYRYRDEFQDLSILFDKIDALSVITDYREKWKSKINARS